MDDVIGHLEAQIRTLTLKFEQLKQVNIKLQHSRAQVVREKDVLMAKHKTAVSQIETMVSRLKSIAETSQ